MDPTISAKQIAKGDGLEEDGRSTNIKAYSGANPNFAPVQTGPDGSYVDTSGIGGGGFSSGFEFVVGSKDVGDDATKCHFLHENGVTDGIRAAITAATSAGGGKIYIRSGSYDLEFTSAPADFIYLPPNVTIAGSGVGSTIINLVISGGYKYEMIHFNGDNITIENFTLNPPPNYDRYTPYFLGTTSHAYLVYCSGRKNITLKNINVPYTSGLKISDGIFRFINTENLNLEKVRMNDNQVSFFYTLAIYMESCIDVKMRDCRITCGYVFSSTGVTPYKTDYALWAISCENILVENGYYTTDPSKYNGSNYSRNFTFGSCTNVKFVNVEMISGGISTGTTFTPTTAAFSLCNRIRCIANDLLSYGSSGLSFSSCDNLKVLGNDYYQPNGMSLLGGNAQSLCIITRCKNGLVDGNTVVMGDHGGVFVNKAMFARLYNSSGVGESDLYNISITGNNGIMDLSAATETLNKNTGVSLAYSIATFEDPRIEELTITGNNIRILGDKGLESAGVWLRVFTTNGNGKIIRPVINDNNIRIESDLTTTSKESGAVVLLEGVYQPVLNGNGIFISGGGNSSIGVSAFLFRPFAGLPVTKIACNGNVIELGGANNHGANFKGTGGSTIEGTMCNNSITRNGGAAFTNFITGAGSGQVIQQNNHIV
jgi:hypothetical protein